MPNREEWAEFGVNALETYYKMQDYKVKQGRENEKFKLDTDIKKAQLEKAKLDMSPEIYEMQKKKLKSETDYREAQVGLATKKVENEEAKLKNQAALIASFVDNQGNNQGQYEMNPYTGKPVRIGEAQQKRNVYGGLESGQITPDQARNKFPRDKGINELALQKETLKREEFKEVKEPINQVSPLGKGGFVERIIKTGFNKLRDPLVSKNDYDRLSQKYQNFEDVVSVIKSGPETEAEQSFIENFVYPNLSDEQQRYIEDLFIDEAKRSATQEKYNL